ncbi:MAG: acyl-CoA/acyl-ACP dehydrogenase [Acidimicrobiia bacterium]|nr:acyl-CoA/acyl-ACP dehydrogenase [Acidimicrobiia bacterium]
MNFELSEEQLALRDTARDLLKQRWSPDRMRHALDAPPARVGDELWAELAALGWTGICASEDSGGSGGDVVTASVLAEEVGRALLPGPLLSAVVAGRVLDRAAGTASHADLLQDHCHSTRRVTLALDEPGANPGLVPTATTADPAAGGWSLTGTKICVPDAEGSDVILVSALAPDGPRLFAVASADVAVTPMRRLDAQATSEVVLDGVHVPADAVVCDETGVEDAFDFAALLAAADLVGTASASLDLAVAYAKDRVQFGRPIGAFQAVAHPLADASVDCEIARSLVYAAALAIEESRPETDAYVSAAKAWAGQATVKACETSLAVHGGIGFTWELDIHLHLRRARAGAASYGDTDFHLDRVAARVGEMDGYAVEAAGSGEDA